MGAGLRRINGHKMLLGAKPELWFLYFSVASTLPVPPPELGRSQEHSCTPFRHSTQGRCTSGCTLAMPLGMCSSQQAASCLLPPLCPTGFPPQHPEGQSNEEVAATAVASLALREDTEGCGRPHPLPSHSQQAGREPADVVWWRAGWKGWGHPSSAPLSSQFSQPHL